MTRTPAAAGLAVTLLFCAAPGCGRRADTAATLPNSTLILADNAAGRHAPDDEMPAPALLQLDEKTLPRDGVLRGSVLATWNKDEFRVLWVDGARRVIDAFEVVPPPKDKVGEPVTFELQLPPGAIGANHQLLLVSAAPAKDKKKPPQFRMLAQVEFSVPHLQKGWHDYAIIDGSQLPALISPEEHPLRSPDDFKDDADTYANSRDLTVFNRTPPLFDETALEAAREDIVTALAASDAAPPLWSLGRNLSLTRGAAPFDYDRSDETAEIFRGWLAQRYGSLEALNRQWGTQYKAWEDVQPATTDGEKAAHDAGYAAALQMVKNGLPPSPSRRLPAGGENFSAWCDFRAFNDFAFARILRELRDETLKLYPVARCGVQNIIGPYAWGGWDHSELLRVPHWTSDSASAATREIIRGLAPKMLCLTAVANSATPPLFRLWDRWLRGDVGCIIEPAAADAEKHAEAAPLPDFGSGLTLLRNSARAHQDSIALYYSPQSVRLHWMFDSEFDSVGWLNHDENQPHSALLQYEAWLLLLEDLGYAPRFIGPQQLLSGEPIHTKTKVLILPKVLSLSDAEAAQLRDFVRLGGTLIADGACGTFDGYGKRRARLDRQLRPRGALDIEFGIGRTDFELLERNGAFAGKGDGAQARLQDAVSGRPFGPASDELRVLEPGVQPMGAVAHARAKSGAAALLQRAGGLGRYIYLNLCLQDYPQLRSKKSLPGFQFHGLTPAAYAKQFGVPTGGEALRLIIGDLLSEVVPDNPLRVLNADGVPLRGFRRARYSLGDGAEFFGVIPNASLLDTPEGEQRLGAPLSEPTAAWLALPQPRHWYDLRKQEYLGQHQLVEVMLQPEQAVLVATLPYKVQGIDVKVRRTDPRGEFKVIAAIVPGSEKAAVHALRVEVFDPAGQRIPYYAQEAVTENGVWTGAVHLGLNEAAGNYRIVVRDLISGQQADGMLLKETQEYSGIIGADAPRRPVEPAAPSK